MILDILIFWSIPGALIADEWLERRSGPIGWFGVAALIVIGGPLIWLCALYALCFSLSKWWAERSAARRERRYWWQIMRDLERKL